MPSQTPETPYILFYSRADVEEPENLPRAVLSSRLQLALTKDQSEYEAEKNQAMVKFYRQNQNDDPLLQAVEVEVLTHPQETCLCVNDSFPSQCTYVYETNYIIQCSCYL